MSEDSVNAYEGLFLFPQSKAATLREAVDHIEEIIGRAEAELISLRKWDERRLAYEIKGNKRGTYFLVYFMVDPDQMTNVERACNLSELLLRSMVIRADHLSREKMDAADGQAELADEIRLRSSDASAATEAATEAATSESATSAAESAPKPGEASAEAFQPAADA